jgi:serine/threonine-protein kinase
VKAVFYDAIDLPLSERAAFVRRSSAGDDSFRRLVESLLSNDQAARSFIEMPAAARLGMTSGSQSSAGRPQPFIANRGDGPQESAEIRALLYQRLRIATAIALGANGLFYALRFLRLDFTPSLVLFTMLPGAVYLAVVAVLAVLLSRERSASTARLRVFEGVLFGVSTLYFAGETYTPLFVDPAWFYTYAARHPSEMSILAREPTLFWMMLIFGYGTLVPNTGRRCAAVTTLMALTPLIVVGVAAGLSPLIPARSLSLFLTEMALWMGSAVALAIYGSHKITVLRGEAQAARNLGQYQLKECLGRGGMGEVYLAEHLLLKRPCAVKVIRPDKAGDPGMAQRFLREVQVTATLTHPNTVQVYDYGLAGDGTVFYAMEYLTGLSLEELVGQHGPPSAGRTIHVLRQLCGALAEAHGAGLIHCDIKPTNVIVCSRGGLHDVAKLLDFGLARMQITRPNAAGLSEGRQMFGTPSYMSPEQAAGRTDLDGRSDIYSLGALAYFLVAGRPPFVRDTVVQTMAAQIEEAAPALTGIRPGVPPDLEECILRCLAKDPDDRFADMGSLDRALGACRSASEWTQSEAAAWWSTAFAEGGQGGPPLS